MILCSFGHWLDRRPKAEGIVLQLTAAVTAFTLSPFIKKKLFILVSLFISFYLSLTLRRSQFVVEFAESIGSLNAPSIF